jgi:hypothetical protein
MVDIFTILPSFMGFYSDRVWIGKTCRLRQRLSIARVRSIGLRFLRVLPIINLPSILQSMELIKQPRTIRLTRLASRFIAIWFAVAGAVHVVENSGDFFCQFCNGQEIDLFNAVYFVIITMTTVCRRFHHRLCVQWYQPLLGWIR